MHQLFQLTRIISQSLNSRFSSYHLHFSEWGIVLILMEKGSMTQNALANYLHIEASAVSRSLVGLEKKGYVKRSVGVDRREKVVGLTDAAIECFQECDKIASQHRQSLLSVFSEEKKHELSGLLQAIIQSAHMEKPK
jgi:DNA-binding MarR family transcriptional regulator